jgi:DNA-binding response OmpR family regulator
MMFIVPKVLIGKRVLIVEDEALVTFLIEDILTDCGCITVGPYGTVEKALHAVQSEAFDAAILDINVAGVRVDPVAFALVERHIPFLFLSGYGDEVLWPDHPDWKVCGKPFMANDLVALLSATLDNSYSPSAGRDGSSTTKPLSSTE